MSTPPALQLDLRLVDGPVPYEPPPFLETGGGENAFLGRTRAEDHEVHGALRSLRYEAKASMALKVLEELARDAAGRHGLVFVRVLLGPGHACAVPWRFGGAAERGRAAQVVHSVGEVPVGQASVLVQVLSPHRVEAFAATAEIMDRLKKKVPIWKQEVWADGATWQDGKPVEPRS